MEEAVEQLLVEMRLLGARIPDDRQSAPRATFVENEIAVD